MGGYASCELEMGPALDLAAMADIVHGLLAGPPARLTDGHWLRAQSDAAGLGLAASGALEALRVRLSTTGATLLRTGTSLQW